MAWSIVHMVLKFHKSPPIASLSWTFVHHTWKLYFWLSYSRNSKESFLRQCSPSKWEINPQDRPHKQLDSDWECNCNTKCFFGISQTLDKMYNTLFDYIMNYCCRKSRPEDTEYATLVYTWSLHNFSSVAMHAWLTTFCKTVGTAIF